ncbi:unnamed protein product, partial [Callosobruchus maculatus]
GHDLPRLVISSQCSSLGFGQILNQFL